MSKSRPIAKIHKSASQPKLGPAHKDSMETSGSALLDEVRRMVGRPAKHVSAASVAALTGEKKAAAKKKVTKKKDFLLADKTGTNTRKLIAEQSGGKDTEADEKEATDPSDSDDSEADDGGNQIAENLVDNLKHYDRQWFKRTAEQYPEYFIEVSQYDHFARRIPEDKLKKAALAF